jgi:uncharacterized protein YbjQ (UPF0145 family)
MKKNLFLLLGLSVLISFTACKKEKGNDKGNDAEISAHSDDESQFSGDLDIIINEVNLAMESNPLITGRMSSAQQEIVCDADAVFDMMSDPRTITITYDGTNCNPLRTRTGTVIISMAQGAQWKNAGAVVNITFQNLKITRTRDGKSVTINGTKTYTNVSGGLLINLPTLGTITHRISSNGLSVAFNDGTQFSWQVDKQRTYTYNNGVVVTTIGLHSEGGASNIALWGTNRFGRTFTTAITQPLIMRQDCSFRLTAGAVEHKTNLFTATATFGLDANGNPTTCPGTGNYYFKITWTGPNGNTSSTILPY